METVSFSIRFQVLTISGTLRWGASPEYPRSYALKPTVCSNKCELRLNARRSNTRRLTAGRSPSHSELFLAKRCLDLLLIASGHSQTLLARADEVIE